MDTDFKNKVSKGFEAAGQRMETMEMSLSEAKEVIKDLQSRLKQVYRAIGGAGGATKAMDSGAALNRFWPSDEMAKSFGDIALKVIRNTHEKDLAGTTNAGGGALVPEELRDWLIQRIGRYGKFRKNTTIVPMSSSRLMVPKIETDLTIYCPEEGGELTSSDPTFSQVTLTPKTLIALVKVSSELEEDAVIALGEIVGISLARSMAKKEDLIGFLGDGTQTYFGMTGITGAIKNIDSSLSSIAGVKVGSGNAYSELTLGDFEGTVAILPEDFDEDAKWYMSKKFYWNVVHPLAVSAGVANIYDVLSDRKARYLLGYEVEFVSCMPSTEANDQLCAFLGDLGSGSYLGQRLDVILEMNTGGVYFGSNQIGLRGKQRIDVNVFEVGDTSDPGAIVALATAGS